VRNNIHTGGFSFHALPCIVGEPRRLSTYLCKKRREGHEGPSLLLVEMRQNRCEVLICFRLIAVRVAVGVTTVGIIIGIAVGIAVGVTTVCRSGRGGRNGAGSGPGNGIGLNGAQEGVVPTEFHPSLSFGGEGSAAEGIDVTDAAIVTCPTDGVHIGQERVFALAEFMYVKVKAATIRAAARKSLFMLFLQSFQFLVSSDSRRTSPAVFRYLLLLLVVNCTKLPAKLPMKE
jgi:hypothetical protein